MARAKLRLLIAAFAVMAACALLPAPIVHGHAYPLRSDPPSGELIGEPPAEVVIWWTEGVQRGEINVLDSDGARVNEGGLVMDPRDAGVTRTPVAIRQDGVYTVNWSVLGNDGHVTKGSFFFVVGAALPDRAALLAHYGYGDPPQPGAINGMEALGRGLLFPALATLVGFGIAHAFVAGPALRSSEYARARERWSRRSLQAAFGGLVLVTAGSTLLAGARIKSAFGEATFDHWIVFAQETTQGNAYVTTLFVVAAGFVALAAIRRVGFALAAVAGASLLAQWMVSVTSHSAAMVPNARGLFADYGHLLGASLWGGGLLALSVGAPGALRALDETEAARVAARMIRRFSVVAMAGLGTAAATGFVLAAWHVPDAQALIDTSYGNALALKVALALVAAALGGVNRWWVHRRLAAPSAEARTWLFSRGVRVEALVLAGVLVLSGALTSTGTAVSQRAAPRPTEPLRFEGAMGEVDVHLAVLPGTSGFNLVDVAFRAGDEVIEASNVTLLLQHPEQGVELPQIRMEQGPDGVWSAVEAFTVPGLWEARVSAWLDQGFRATWFSVLLPDQPTEIGGQAGHVHSHHAHHHQETTAEAAQGVAPRGLLQIGLQIAAATVALMALAGVAVEALRSRRNDDSGRKPSV